MSFTNCRILQAIGLSKGISNAKKWDDSNNQCKKCKLHIVFLKILREKNKKKETQDVPHLDVLVSVRKSSKQVLSIPELQQNKTSETHSIFLDLNNCLDLTEVQLGYFLWRVPLYHKGTYTCSGQVISSENHGLGDPFREEQDKVHFSLIPSY